MILTIDIGNTQIKCAVFEQHIIIDLCKCKTGFFYETVVNLLKKHPTIGVAVLSRVANIEQDVIKKIGLLVRVLHIDRCTQLPFDNLYSTPKTLGIDRMVLAAGAVLAYPGTNRLVIDAGTCVTYDYINDQNQYLGGAIAPGLQLRYQSLHNYTAQLPLLLVENPVAIIGNNTNQAIHSGVVNGMALEIDGFINIFVANKTNFIIILTGGDADFLAKRLKNTIFANSNFLLESLNHIYQFTNQND